MLFRRTLFLCLIVSCITGCVNVALDSMPVIDHWPTVNKPRPITVTIDYYFLNSNGERDDFSDVGSFLVRKARVQPVIMSALDDSRLFSQATPSQPGNTAFHADISYSLLYPHGIGLFGSSLLSTISVFTIPTFNDTTYELEATFNNPYTGKVLVIKKRGVRREWRSLFLLPWVSGHTREDAENVIVYRMTQDAIEEARSQGFFDVNEAQLEKGFF